MILNWPDDWYSFQSSTFTLRPINLSSQHRWTGGKSVYGPLAYVWVAKLTMATNTWDDGGQDVAAFFSNMGGQSGLVRIGDPIRRMPRRDRSLLPITEPWSDTTLFDDGTGFASGLSPDFVVLSSDAAKGATSIVVRGLAASDASALSRGDLIELRPNGIPSGTPNLYEVQSKTGTDSSGKARVSVLPPLRQGFVAGDMVVLRNPTSVFHLIDDEQGIASVSPPYFADVGFSLIEAIV